MKGKTRRQVRRTFFKALSAETLLLACCGIASLILCLVRVPWMTVSFPWIITAALIPLLSVWIWRRLVSKGSWAVLLVWILVIGYTVWKKRMEIIDLLYAVGDSYLEVPGAKAPDITVLAGPSAALAAILLSILETTLGGHMLLSLIMLAVLLLLPLIGVEPSMAAVLLWLVFFAGYLWLHLQKRQAAGRRAAFDPGWKGRVRILTALIICIVMGSFAAGSYYGAAREDALYRSIFDLEGRIYRFVNRFQTGSADTEEEGTISRSNCYPLNERYLWVYTDRQPSQDIYLRGFSGGAYENGAWKKADETEAFHAIARRVGWPSQEERLLNLQSIMYFIRNQRANGTDSALTLGIQRVRGKDIPYTAYFSRSVSKFIGADDVLHDFGPGTSFMQYYEIGDLYTEPPAADFANQGILENSYLEEVRGMYTDLPEDGLLRMRELVGENPKEDLSEITAFIIYTLRTKASYSLTPGRVPVNEDVTEYFLFESGKGYCEHFASAATILYRLYGIPARYATGYRLRPDAFSKVGTGYWKAEATDQQAHSWVEIFLKGYGWVPVDVTPVSDRPLRTDYPGYDHSFLQEMLAEDHPGIAYTEDDYVIPDIDSLHQPVYMPEFDMETPEQRPETVQSAARGSIKIPKKAIAAIGILVGVFLLLELRRQYLLRIRKRRDCRDLFSMLLAILHAAGLPRKVTAESEQLAEDVMRFFPWIDMNRVVMTAEKEAFSRDGASLQEKQDLLHTVDQAAHKLEELSPRWKRIWYRWGRAYW